jgi:hypothetical protein
MERDEALLLYSSIMVALLAIGYVLIITNPPSDFLRYDNLGRAHTIDNLSYTGITEHWNSVVIFWGLFAVLSFFIGLSTAVVFDIVIKEGVEKWQSEVILTMSLFVLVMLGLLLLPYYGLVLTSTLVPIGYLAGLLGMRFSKTLRERFFIQTIVVGLMVWALIGDILRFVSAQTTLVLIFSSYFILVAVYIVQAVVRWRKRRKQSKT